MKIVNPLNRVPDTDETMVMSCACMCDTGSVNAKTAAAIYDGCGCQCITGNYANNVANKSVANTSRT